MKILYTRNPKPSQWNKDYGTFTVTKEYCCPELKHCDAIRVWDSSGDITDKHETPYLYISTEDSSDRINYCPFCGVPIKLIEQSVS